MDGRLDSIGLIRFGGADAHTFLQGQLSNDLRRLQQGEPLLAALSSPQGRVVAVMRLMPHSSGIFALLPSDLIASTMERLKKFVMRAKVTIEDLAATYVVQGVAAAPASDLAAAQASYAERDQVGTARLPHDPTRQWVFGPRSSLEGAPAGAYTESAWRLADIRAGLPQIYLATTEMFVAQMLNLDLLDGISFSKGCYTGQEIIARTQHLGRIKRRTYRLLLPSGEWQIGQPIRTAEGRAGRLIELAPVEDHFEALAVLGVDAEEPGATQSSSAAVMLPLPYSLEAPRQ
jgi:tRNA-modifying protein YgfZ